MIEAREILSFIYARAFAKAQRGDLDPTVVTYDEFIKLFSRINLAIVEKAERAHLIWEPVVSNMIVNWDVRFQTQDDCIRAIVGETALEGLAGRYKKAVRDALMIFIYPFSFPKVSDGYEFFDIELGLRVSKSVVLEGRYRFSSEVLEKYAFPELHSLNKVELGYAMFQLGIVGF